MHPLNLVPLDDFLFRRNQPDAESDGGGDDDASDNEPDLRLARELHRPEGTCDCDG